jgi:hypothetical protein
MTGFEYLTPAFVSETIRTVIPSPQARHNAQLGRGQWLTASHLSNFGYNPLALRGASDGVGICWDVVQWHGTIRREGEFK